MTRSKPIAFLASAAVIPLAALGVVGRSHICQRGHHAPFGPLSVAHGGRKLGPRATTDSSN